MEANHEKNMKVKFAALLEGGDTALKDAHHKLEEATNELKSLTMKFEGAESALNMAQQRLKSAENKANDLTRQVGNHEANMKVINGIMDNCMPCLERR